MICLVSVEDIGSWRVVGSSRSQLSTVVQEPATWLSVREREEGETFAPTGPRRGGRTYFFGPSSCQQRRRLMYLKANTSLTAYQLPAAQTILIPSLQTFGSDHRTPKLEAMSRGSGTQSIL